MNEQVPFPLEEILGQPEIIATAFLSLEQRESIPLDLVELSLHVSCITLQRFLSFPLPTCTWAETKLEVLLTCLWFGSQLGITFSAPQATPRILLAKYYWCPGATS